jgi:hypothetical protein
MIKFIVIIVFFQWNKEAFSWRNEKGAEYGLFVKITKFWCVSRKI